MVTKSLTGKRADLRDLYDGWLENNIISVKCPVVLISQLQRSGGTLLCQLFDGHPQCHVHPPEWHIAYSGKGAWPELDLGAPPEEWFKILFETQVSTAFRKGYQKFAGDEVDRFPFLFLPSLQREIFLRCLTRTKVTSPRDVFDAYMTSYFNAWLDNQNRYGPKKIVTAFAAGFATRERNVERFFDVYPDGKLLSTIRDPETWYVSARGYSEKRWGDFEHSLGQWQQAAQSMLKSKERYGDRVCILKFEDVLAHTEATMRSLAPNLGIHFDNALLVPTFNKFPIRAHSSFPVESGGVVLDPLSRRELLTSKERDAIKRLTGETYERVVQFALRVERLSALEQKQV
ncbi:MAG: hypothetical protein A3F90_13415 [Deltaproteobacteria bacterium RIFCSPLOWO2_12_FULL_60_19]|nr:MAG: hypothetical protein A3F90_13415 [Deltaproteobacteria bacterium RIFCSPLOWO2_12_FULL_60_19]